MFQNGQSGAVLLLSPHRDDAAFSCGLLLEQLLAAGVTVRIANVCTISDYAPYLDEATLPSDAANRVEAISQIRAEEDGAFANMLAQPALLQWVALGWQDAPLRHRMPTESVLLPGKLRADELERLTDEFRRLPPASVVLAPLAVGEHLDHRLVRDAAALAWSPDALLFYDDLPYLSRIPESLRAVEVDAALPWPCGSWFTEPAHAGDKRRLVSHYPSQVAPEVFDELERHAAETSYTERFHGIPEAISVLSRLLQLKGAR